MQRYFLQIAYKGTAYRGWQVQPNETTVQGVLEKAIGTILRKGETPVVGCGRTDTGVHAQTYFLHFDHEEDIDSWHFVHHVNNFLPPDIAVHGLFKAHADAHARFDAVSRAYEYHIHLRKSPFLDKASLYHHKKLDVDRMQEAAKLLLKFSDFASFCKVGSDVKTTLCDLKESFWTTKEDGRLVYTVKADRFLRNMVRAIVGTLLDVGMKKKTLEEVEDLVLAKDRSRAGKSIAAHGLYLTEVVYPYPLEHA